MRRPGSGGAGGWGRWRRLGILRGRWAWCRPPHSPLLGPGRCPLCGRCGPGAPLGDRWGLSPRLSVPGHPPPPQPLSPPPCFSPRPSLGAAAVVQGRPSVTAGTEVCGASVPRDRWERASPSRPRGSGLTGVECLPRLGCEFTPRRPRGHLPRGCGAAGSPRHPRAGRAQRCAVPLPPGGLCDRVAPRGRGVRIPPAARGFRGWSPAGLREYQRASEGGIPRARCPGGAGLGVGGHRWLSGGGRVWGCGF